MWYACAASVVSCMILRSDDDDASPFVWFKVDAGAFVACVETPAPIHTRRAVIRS